MRLPKPANDSRGSISRVRQSSWLKDNCMGVPIGAAEQGKWGYGGGFRQWGSQCFIIHQPHHFVLCFDLLPPCSLSWSFLSLSFSSSDHSHSGLTSAHCNRNCSPFGSKPGESRSLRHKPDTHIGFVRSFDLSYGEEAS